MLLLVLRLFSSLLWHVVVILFSLECTVCGRLCLISTNFLILFVTLCVIRFWSHSCILLMAVSDSIAKVFIKSLCMQCRLYFKLLSKSFIPASVNMTLITFPLRLLEAFSFVCLHMHSEFSYFNVYCFIFVIVCSVFLVIFWFITVHTLPYSFAF